MSTLIRRGAGPLVVAVAGIGMAVATWGTWPDPVTDFGKELYIAWQLALGRRLYLDVAYHLGPLSPYVNALAMKVFGPTLATIEFLNLTILTAIIILAYRLIARMAGSLAATVSGVTFVTLFAFPHFTKIADYNFVCPYDHAHTHGILLGLIGLTAAENYVRTARRWGILVAGFAVGLAFLTRAELFVAAAAGVGAVLLKKPRDFQAWVLFAAAALLPILIAWGLLSVILPAHLAFRGLLGSWPIVFDTSVAGNKFYRDSMGTLDFSASLKRLVLWTFCWSVLVLPAMAAGRLKKGKILWAVATFIWGAAGMYLCNRNLNLADAFAPLPWALVGCLIYLRMKKGDTFKLAAGTIVWALVLLGKIILNARIYHYGFALAMPATLLVMAIGVGLPPLPVRAAVMGALSVAIIAYLSVAWGYISQQTYSVAEGANQFWANERGGMLNQVLVALRQQATPRQTLAVMPEGAMLNFLAQMDNPTPYWSFNPPYAFFAPGQGEALAQQKMVDALMADPPDWIALAAEDLSEFGTPFFGHDYGLPIYAFVQRGYYAELRVGDPPFTGRGFGMILMRRTGYNGLSTPAGESNAVSPR